MSGTRVVFFGYHTFGARALQALLDAGEDVGAVVTHADDPAEGDGFESVAGLARAHGLRVVTSPSPDRPDVAAAVADLAPDLILSVWYRRLLGPDLLAAPRVAALNLHGSLLPAYRGRAPLNWVLVNGEARTGVTLHHMTAAADAGDIVAQEVLEIGPTETAPDLYRRMVKEGVDLLTSWYPRVMDGTAPRRPQDEARATVFPRRRPEDGRVAWEWPARRIANMVRAVTHPYPGAFVGDGAERLYLWAAEVAAEPARAAPPGTVLGVAGDDVTIATGDGALRLRRVQPAGGPEDTAGAWAARWRWRAGAPAMVAR